MPTPLSTSEFSIVAQKLTHRYGEHTVLDGVELRLKPGEFFGFLGQNGAGKSTAIRALCGFLKPTEGEIRVAGVDVVRHPTELRRHIGVLSEDVEVYDRLTGAEFLEFAGRMHGLTRAEARRRAGDLLERMELTGAANRMIGTYSLGMRKKTAFAAALIHAPRVLFLDEPFNGVDTASTRTLCALLLSLARERAVTIFFTSHVLDMAERLCTRVAVLQDGRIRREGTVAELKADAESQGATLEDVFLQLTGARQEIDPALDWFA
jgi:ABC-2 type transport system ATP-binding protein